MGLKPRPIQEATYEEMHLADLVPADYNPREISDEAYDGLNQSISRLGLVQPLVWNKRTKTLVGGHQRLKVLLDHGVDTTTVAVVSLSKRNEKALNVALNNPHTAGTFTKDLQGLLASIKAEDLDLFTDVRLDSLWVDEVLGDTTNPGSHTEVESRTKPNQLWQLGAHRLYVGDSTAAQDVTRLVGPHKAQCMWTDPPYGVDYVGKTGDALTITNDGAAKLDELLCSSFKHAHDLALKPNAGVYVSYASTSNTISFWRALEEAGFTFREELIWVKSTMVMGRMDYHYKHEPIWYGYKPGKKTFGRPIGAKKKTEGWYGNAKQTTVFEVAKPKANKVHPTMKPVELVQEMIINSTRPGDWVYEPFAGSGSTLLACELTDRKCLAMELAPKYCDAIISRWEEMTGDKAVRID